MATIRVRSTVVGVHKYRAKPVWDVLGRAYDDKAEAMKAAEAASRMLGHTVLPLFFASTREYRRWCELVMLKNAGKIKDLQRQVRFKSKPKPEIYQADFTYIENGKFICEDSKGFRTPAFLRKRRWMKSDHGIDIRET